MFTNRAAGKMLRPVALLLIVLTASTHAAIMREDLDATVPLQAEAVNAIKRAQKWLVKKQGRSGTWGNNGNTAMAVMALMVSGNSPGKGEFGAAISKGIDYLISTQDGNGFMAVGRRGPMYQHALATLALAEAYGMTSNPSIRDALIKGVDLIVQCQDYGGGWRYSPRPSKGDMSVTVMQVMALRAAAETGVYVPDETIEHAMRFINDCWNPEKAGWTYMKRRGTINFNRTAAGIVCLQSLGRYDDPRLKRAVESVQQRAFNEDKGRHFWYGHYYASVALYHYG